MSKKFAIKGHSTRGKEVIELLKMLGGRDSGYGGLGVQYYYYISQFGNIEGSSDPYEFNTYIVFTLEEFLEKYPFKVGDKVEVCGTNNVFTIGNMIWEDELCTVHYANMEDFEYYTAKELKLYKETNMNENKFGTAVNPVESKSNAVGLKDDKINVDAIFSFNHTMRPEVNADGMLCYKIPDGYESFSIQEGMIILKPLKPKYPKTYEECCKITEDVADASLTCFACNLLNNFQKLLLCRNAYWKIAGEQMGLDKPWEPDWNNSTSKYTIVVIGNDLVEHYTFLHNCILAFPTEEMRDTFYEYFKDLIEQCKELL